MSRDRFANIILDMEHSVHDMRNDTELLLSTSASISSGDDSLITNNEENTRKQRPCPRCKYWIPFCPKEREISNCVHKKITVTEQEPCARFYKGIS